MRLFVALEVPGRIRRSIAERLDMLRHRLPAARWVPIDRLHLTLAFLDDVTEAGCASLQLSLDSVFAGTPALLLQLDGAGTFPLGRPARVAWIGVDANAELLGLERRLQAVIASTLQRPLEERVFHAHVTVERCRRPWRRTESEAFAYGLAGKSGSWEARRGVLVESRLGRGGPRYSVLQEYPLAS